MQLPTDFSNVMQDLLQTEWPTFEESLRSSAQRALRLHKVSTNPMEHIDQRQDVQFPVQDPPLLLPDALRRELYDPVPWSKDAFYIPLDSSLGRSVYHETGAFYIQEPSAMAVVAALAPKRHEHILDLCAAPGGKSSAIGRALAGTGQLVANEIHPTRVRVLAQNLERMGVPAVITNESPERLSTPWAGLFDAVLVDAPCSGEGMFRKDPGARAEWTITAPQSCAIRQKHILEHAIQMVQPGGRLIYSTCTFNPTENEQIIRWLIDTYGVELLDLPQWPGWEEGRPEWAGGHADLAKTRRLWPHTGRGEGHFIAAMRIHHGIESSLSRNQFAHSDPVPSGFKDWLSDLVAAPPASWLTPTVRGHHIFTPMTHPIPTEGLKVLRTGICLASVERGRFEPHHQAAMAFADNVALRRHAVTQAEARDFLTGQTLSQGESAGWNWIHLDGLPLGWGKSVSGRMNNAYPKGLRRADLILL